MVYRKFLTIFAFSVCLTATAQKVKTKVATNPPGSIPAVAYTKNVSDSALLDVVQKQTFRYFWDFAHPVSGLARERSNEAYNYGSEVVTTGGTGFGVMSVMLLRKENGLIGTPLQSFSCAW